MNEVEILCSIAEDQISIYQEEFVIRRVHSRDNVLYLVSHDETVKPVRLIDLLEQIFGVVAYNVHSLRGSN